MICERCKFAEWERTEKGRLHPGGVGKCNWRGVFRVAGSAYAGSIHRHGEPIVVEGRLIFRKKGDQYPAKCDVFQPIDKGPHRQ